MTKKLKSIELFAGAGGMALGFEHAGYEHVALNEFNPNACKTLRTNRPDWKILEGDIAQVKWNKYAKENIDIVCGGFPCQPFSHSGKRLGLEDTRGTLFYEFAKCLKETNATSFLAENVKGLLTHDEGRTLPVIINAFEELGYHVYSPFIVNANDFEVAQKRERLIIFGIKKEFKNMVNFNLADIIKSAPKRKPLVIKDIFRPGKQYPNPLPDSPGTLFSEKKAQYFKLVPEGGNWKSIDPVIAEEYMGPMYHSGGGKTGVLKRLSWNEPSPTILTSPSQKQTERAHPTENRPLTIRECARVQSFPDEWKFEGSVSEQYKQIGNAVPVNLAKHLANYLKPQLEAIQKLAKKKKKHSSL